MMTNGTIDTLITEAQSAGVSDGEIQTFLDQNALGSADQLWRLWREPTSIVPILPTCACITAPCPCDGTIMPSQRASGIDGGSLRPRIDAGRVRTMVTGDELMSPLPGTMHTMVTTPSIRTPPFVPPSANGNGAVVMNGNGAASPLGLLLLVGLAGIWFASY